MKNFLNKVGNYLNRPILPSDSQNQVIIHKQNGKIIVNPKEYCGFSVTFYGRGNFLEIFEPCVFIGNNNLELCGNGCKCTLIKCQLANVHVVMQHQANLSIDERSTVCGYIHLANERDLSVSIGKDCMFSGCPAIWATDGHQIKDATSNKVINRTSHGIVISDHCWIGYNSTILKNTVLPYGTIVGANSVVSGQFTEANTCIAGNPAKVIKRNILWDRAPLD